MSNTDMSIFDTFIAAKQALDELPAAREQVGLLTADLANANSTIQDRDITIMYRDDEISRLKAELASKEAALAEATFRDKQSQETLSTLRGLLGVHATVVGIEPAPVTPVTSEASMTSSEPTPSTVTEATPAPTGEAGSPQPGAGAASTVPNGEMFSPYADDPRPTPQSPSDAGGEGGSGGTETKSVLEIAQDSFKASMESKTEPVVDPLPYSGRPHWQKPAVMEWSEWIAKGGDKPYWMTDDNDDKINF